MDKYIPPYTNINKTLSLNPMYCKNCRNQINNADNYCNKCGLKLDFQACNKDKAKNDMLTRIWIACAIGLVGLSFAVLFSGVLIGIGTGYENPDSTFDFAPFGISFAVINGINIVFNIVMIVVKIRNKKRL